MAQTADSTTIPTAGRDVKVSTDTTASLPYTNELVIKCDLDELSKTTHQDEATGEDLARLRGLAKFLGLDSEFRKLRVESARTSDGYGNCDVTVKRVEDSGETVLWRSTLGGYHFGGRPTSTQIKASYITHIIRRALGEGGA